MTIVFLPRLTANHTLFEKQITYFYDKYNVIVWDCPCHGKSRPYKNFNYSNVSKELNTILKTEGIGKTVIIGQSLGGMISQYYIDAYPITDSYNNREWTYPQGIVDKTERDMQKARLKNKIGELQEALEQLEQEDGE